ncbi:MAG: EF-P beta-lysylation protein EpmB [Pseudomonadota bacterium]
MSSTNIYSLTRDHQHSAIENTAQSAWQIEYKNAISNLETLCDELELDINDLPVDRSRYQTFPLRVPHSYVKRMQKSNPTDPLLLQVLPNQLEQQEIAGFIKDPVGDLRSVKSSGLLQKYHGRALLITSSCCAIHCRYCFRRHFPYSEQNPRKDSWIQAIEELKNDKSINEIILSGGDPLTLSDQKLEELVKKLETIQHITTLRVHTRLPVVIPNRINSSLLAWIKNTRLKLVMVLHINHAQEINHELQNKLNLLVELNCMLLNQSVLLRTINADTKSLENLSKKLLNANIMPYYLHLLDKVAGAAHFDVPENEARLLMRKVAKRLPGYLVPKLVKEIPGETSKRTIDFQAPNIPVIN